MPIDNIIAEIDEYLVRLEMARSLLTEASRTVAHRKASTKQHHNRAMQPATAPRSRGMRLQASKLRRTGKRSNTNEGKSVESFSTPENSAADLTSTTKNPAVLTQTEARIPIKRVELPIAKRLPMPSGSQRRTRRRAAIEKPATAQPAIALSGSNGHKIVVVSPEEARRAREQAVPSTPKRRFTSNIPSTGRLAFEALFKDEADPSKVF